MTNPPQDTHCVDCAFYAELRDMTRGECRRYAPRKGSKDAVSIELYEWPVVRLSDWCGEHKTDSQEK